LHLFWLSFSPLIILNTSFFCSTSAFAKTGFAAKSWATWSSVSTLAFLTDFGSGTIGGYSIGRSRRPRDLLGVGATSSGSSDSSISSSILVMGFLSICS
jgi:hypothetical protein